MQTLITLNNIAVIALGFLLFLRAILWYFKKDSPFLQGEASITGTCVLFFVVVFCTTISYAMHGEMIDRALYLCGCLYSVGILITVMHYLMELREKLPDSRTKKNDSSYF